MDCLFSSRQRKIIKTGKKKQECNRNVLLAGGDVVVAVVTLKGGAVIHSAASWVSKLTWIIRDTYSLLEGIYFCCHSVLYVCFFLSACH